VSLRRCLFLDRDGVINVKQPDGHYVCQWNQFQWIEETIDWIRLFNALDFLVIVVTNQRAVAKGLISLDQLADIHRRMVEELARRGAVIDDVLACPHEIDACDCRKPKPGLIHAAQQRWPIDLAGSLMVGDSPSDRQLAENCGLRFVEVCDGKITDVSLPAKGDNCNVAG
jgi:histidinol-phosphate phosphatase family protein